MGKIKFLFIVTFLLSLNAFAQSIEGVVLSAEDSLSPIPGAKIQCLEQQFTTITNAKGEWVIENVDADHILLSISSLGFETLTLDHPEFTNNRLIVYLQPSHRDLDKVIVSTEGKLQRESITNVVSLPMTELETIPTSNIGEALDNIPGVTTTSLGQGISKPVIRGLSGSQVVTYINGLRLQSQQWGGDHGLPITSLGVGNLEVIKGPASLLYGADALGGVIYFSDLPYAPNNTVEGFVRTSFFSNSLGTNNQAGISLRKNKWRFQFYAGYDNHADYGVPTGPQVANSRYNQTSGKFNVGYVHKNWISNIRYNYYYGRIGLPGHSHEVVTDSTAFFTSQQNRSLNLPAQNVQNHAALWENKFFLKNHEFNANLGFTYNDLKEYEEKYFTPAFAFQLSNLFYNVKWKWHLTNHLDWINGTQGMFQQNRNAETAEEILIPNADMNDIGVYSLLVYELKKWRFLAGGRWDNRQINTFGTIPFQNNYSGVNYSLGFVRNGDKSTWRFNASSGFRAPNSIELLSNGIHHGAFRYEIGNTNLKPEKAMQLDMSFGLHLEDFELIINPYFNLLNNYIIITPTDSIIDEFNVYEYQQLDQAILYGSDFGLHYHPHGAHWLHLETALSTVFAEDLNQSALPQIPATSINTQIRFMFENKSQFKNLNLAFQHQYFFKQNRVVPFELTTGDYHLINASLNITTDTENPVNVGIGVRNLLNTAYIPHLSQLRNIGIPNPGINAFVSVKYEFKSNLKTK